MNTYRHMMRLSLMSDLSELKWSVRTHMLFLRSGLCFPPPPSGRSQSLQVCQCLRSELSDRAQKKNNFKFHYMIQIFHANIKKRERNVKKWSYNGSEPVITNTVVVLMRSCSFERRHRKMGWVSAVPPHPTPPPPLHSPLLSPCHFHLSAFRRSVCPHPSSSPRRHNNQAGCQSPGSGKCEGVAGVGWGGGEREPCCEESFPLPAGQEDVLVQCGGCW